MNSIVNDYYDRVVSKIKEYETFTMYQNLLCGDGLACSLYTCSYFILKFIVDIFYMITNFWYRLFLRFSSAIGLDDSTTDSLLIETSLNASTFSSTSDNISLSTVLSSQSNPFIENFVASSLDAIQNLGTSSGIGLNLDPERTGIAAYIPYETMDKVYNFLLNFLFPLKKEPFCSISAHPSTTFQNILNFTRRVVLFTDKDNGVKFDSHFKCVYTLTTKRDYKSFSFLMALVVSAYIVTFILYKLGRILFSLIKKGPDNKDTNGEGTDDESAHTAGTGTDDESAHTAGTGTDETDSESAGREGSDNEGDDNRNADNENANREFLAGIIDAEVLEPAFGDDFWERMENLREKLRAINIPELVVESDDSN